jgi:predicted membrane protein
MILIGALFLSLNLGWIHIHASGSWIFPLILIGIGCMALFGVLDSSPHPRMRFARARAHFARSFEADNVVGDFALLGSVKRKLETNDFRGGGLATILGSVEIDLRLSAITVPENTAVLNANAIFGAIKLRVPQYWRVHLHGMSILGNFEDKTVPPNTGPNAPVLVITGWSIFGSVEVED